MRKVLCFIRHRFVAWETTIQVLSVDTALGSWNGYTWQEVCSRCFAIRWTAGERRPTRFVSERLERARAEHDRRQVEKLFNK